MCIRDSYCIAQHREVVNQGRVEEAGTGSSSVHLHQIRFGAVAKTRGAVGVDADLIAAVRERVCRPLQLFGVGDELPTRLEIFLLHHALCTLPASARTVRTERSDTLVMGQPRE